LNARLTRYRSPIAAAAIAGALALSYTPVAMAAKPPTETGQAKVDLAAAKKHYADGEKKFRAGDFSGARDEFVAANGVKSTPQAERYIGLCEDSLGHLQEAVAWYDKFLAHVPEKLAAQGDEIRKREGEIKASPGKVHIESNPPGATVSIDGKPQAGPTPVDVELAPGSHTIKLTEQGRLPAEKSIDVGFASAQSVSADLDVEPPPPPPPPAAPPPVAVAAPAPPPAAPPPPPEPHSLVPAYVTGGLAVVAAGVGTVFGVMALNDKSNYNQNPTSQTADNGDTHALIADMAFGVALTFGVTSAVLFFTKDEQPAPAPATAKADKGETTEPKRQAVTFTPAPWVGQRSGGAGFVLQF
jgi:hypothetical protein